MGTNVISGSGKCAVIKTVDGKEVKAKTTVDEKQVVFWSANYAKRAKMERQSAIDKANDLIGNVRKYNKKNCYGAAKYIKHLVNIYRFCFYDEILKDIGNLINIDFSLKNRALKDIKKILGNTKIS